ncbi:Single-stranded DNA-binding protein WHY2, mitochondrial [Dendrobium catenatum]|uniref:Single-stranded DNA-binding protein WHY2, mitochondrial n=1 Tax=Dendrobium catenatum TaxID=906689 RepID=A0A2I0W0K1_9ASPA|nr:Single-stranded DNA-binding protein WHY2, mitochondrial [Dendrobium catenatum]
MKECNSFSILASFEGEEDTMQEKLGLVLEEVEEGELIEVEIVEAEAMVIFPEQSGVEQSEVDFKSMDQGGMVLVFSEDNKPKLLKELRFWEREGSLGVGVQSLICYRIFLKESSFFLAEDSGKWSFCRSARAFWLGSFCSSAANRDELPALVFSRCVYKNTDEPVEIFYWKYSGVNGVHGGQQTNLQAVSSYFLAEKLSYVRDASWSYNLVSERGISTAGSERSSGKAFADFSIFKGKAALLMSPVPPTFTKMDSGHQRVDKKGVILLKFIPAIATEVGCLISLGPDESCEFFHDPSMKSSLEGQVKKTLTISPLNDGGGYMFNLSVMNAVQKTNERFTLPVTKAEFSVMRTACGWVYYSVDWSVDEDWVGVDDNWFASTLREFLA